MPGRASNNLRPMKAVILAGGFGSRLSEETAVRPKPMVEIGGKPMLWHIMKIYAAHGIDDFVICLGYKGYLIKEYFANYYLHTCDVSFDLAGGGMEVHRSTTEPWRVTLVDTGENTMTGGRLQRVLPYLGRRGLLLHLRRRRRGHRHHRRDRLPPRARSHRDGHGRAAARPLRSARDRRTTSSREFEEKPRGDGGWMNGGFFVLSPRRRELPRRRRHRVGAAADARARARRRSSPPTAHAASGRRWTRSATATSSSELWNSGGAPWRTWE